METDYAPAGGWFTSDRPQRLTRWQRYHSTLWLFLAQIGAVFGVVTIFLAFATALTKVTIGLWKLI